MEWMLLGTGVLCGLQLSINMPNPQSGCYTVPSPKKALPVDIAACLP